MKFANFIPLGTYLINEFFAQLELSTYFFYSFIFWKLFFFETLLLPLFSHHWRQWVLDIMCFFSCAFIKGWTFSRSVKQCPLRPRKVIFSPTTYLHYSNFWLTDLWRFYIKPNDTKTPLRFLWRKLLQLNIYDLWVLKQNHEWVERIFLQTHKKRYRVVSSRIFQPVISFLTIFLVI